VISSKISGAGLSIEQFSEKDFSKSHKKTKKPVLSAAEASRLHNPLETMAVCYAPLTYT